jgi:hypothetical protein
MIQRTKQWLILNGGSNNDNNLFSTIDDANNTGISAKISAKQRIFSKRWNLDAFTIINLYNNLPVSRKTFNIEFDRDWNLNTVETGIKVY